MDERTADFYRDYVSEGGVAAEAPRSAISAWFGTAFPQGARILDVGAGSGRDVAALRNDGFDAWGVEPNAALRAFAVRSHPWLAGRLKDGALPFAAAPFGGRFDGIVCSAVLMHVPAAALDAALASLGGLLEPGGKVLLSLPWMRPALLDGGRDGDGRSFCNHAPVEVVGRMATLGFAHIDLGEAATTVLPDVTWTILLFAAASASVHAAI